MARLRQVVGRIADLPPAVIDTALAVGIFTIGTIDALFSADPKHPHLPQIPLLAVGAIGVALRRKNLWVAFGLVQIAALASLILDLPPMSGHGGFLEEGVIWDGARFPTLIPGANAIELDGAAGDIIFQAAWA